VKKFSRLGVRDRRRVQQLRELGWEFGAQATASAQAAGKGASLQGTVSVSPGVWLAQLAGDSLALELTAKGTKYYKDADLN
jgi:hypothetical protein